MKRLYTDFQAVENGACWILRDAKGVEGDALRLTVGERVILDAHEDFEVTGIIDHRHINLLGRSTWVAFPQWDTRTEK